MQVISLPQLEIAVQLFIAVVLGGIIGFDRERKRKPAGFRTHMLVAGAAAFLVSVGVFVDQHYVSALSDQVIRSDPIRVIGAIITGISFLGAGTIMRTREGPVEGLTTAATLLFAATIGIGVGVGAYLVAVLATFLVVLILKAGIRVENWLGIRE